MQNSDRNGGRAVEQNKRHWDNTPPDEGQGMNGVHAGSTSADAQTIDLNHATSGQLMDIEGIAPALAHAIVEYRTHHGHFRTWEDVAQVPGLSPELVRNVQHAARIGGVEVSA